MKIALVGFFSGVLFVLSWIIFLDGQVTSHDAFPPTHILTPLICTLATIMVNLVSPNHINNKVKVWLFIWFTIQCVCIGVSSFVLATDYSPEDNYAGVTLLLQNAIVMFAGLVFFIGRKNSIEF